MLLKAKGSFRPGFAVIRPDGVSDHNFLGPNERQCIGESKSKLCGWSDRAVQRNARKHPDHAVWETN